jgi:hypothetical protein
LLLFGIVVLWIKFGLSAATLLGSLIALLFGGFGFFNFVVTSLYAPVVMMEGKSGRAALKRSRDLVGRSRELGVTAVPIFVLTSAIGGGMGPIVAGWLAMALRNAVGSAMSGEAVLVAAVGLLATFATSVLVNPIVAIFLARGYLKMRQAGGETLDEALGRFREEAPRSRWQERMRSGMRLKS